MKESTKEKYINLIKSAAEEGKTLYNYCESHNLMDLYNSLFVLKANLKSKQNRTDDENEFIDYIQSNASQNSGHGIKNNLEYATPRETNDPDKDKTWIIRDDNDKITGYKFEIHRWDGQPLTGTLNRTEMAEIYRMYSYYGASLTQRQVSRFLPEYTLVDFKRILRAFNITKASGPFPPHYLEEHTDDELLEISSRERENNLLKKIEENKSKDTEKLLKKVMEDNYNLKNTLKSREEVCKNLEISTDKFTIDIPTTSEDTLIIWLSDIHVGAYNDKFGYFELTEYSEKEIVKRLTTVLQTILASNCKNLIVCNLGDNLDSYNKKTSRGTEIESNMNNKEMSKLYIKLMTEFFNTITSANKFDSIKYYAVGESNHSADWGWIHEIALCNIIEHSGVKCYIADRPIDQFECNGNVFIYLHGNDSKNQFKGFPLTLNDKTELWFSDYIYTNKIHADKNIYVVKGDLHRYAYTTGKIFNYVSVGSLYASSNWITANFGLTKWSCSYMQVDKLGNVLSGEITE